MTSRHDEIVISTHRPDRNDPKGRGIFWNKSSFSDIDEAVAEIQSLDAEPYTTVYFTVGSFKDHREVDPQTGKVKIKRKQVNATWFKALALDLDIGDAKGYQTQKEGFAALMAAVNSVGLPIPMVVSSGNGLHVYWPLDESVPVKHWERMSIALRMALEEQGVVIDTSKIHDPSMVLRPVGTHHKKQVPWKPVEVKHAPDADYPVMEIATILKPWIGKTPAVAKPAHVGKAKQSSIAAAVLSSHDVILDEVVKRCAQVRALVESGGQVDAAGRNVEEPLWRVTMGLAAHTTDQHDAIIRLAGQHPDFDLATSTEKMRGWAGGPPLCSTFEQHCSAGCQGCPYRGNIRSPASLSRQTEVEVPAAFVNAPEDAPAIVLPLPPGYVIYNGALSREVRTPQDDGSESIEYDHISDYEMHVTGIYQDPASGKSTFRLMIKYPHVGYKEEAHDMSVIAAAGKDFGTLLMDRQVFVKALPMQEKIRGYIVDYLKMVQQQAPSGIDFTSFGWQPDGSFMCGEQLINSPNGVTDTRLRGAAQHLGAHIRPVGTRDGWVQGMAMLNRPGTETIRAAVLLSTIGLLGPAAGNSTLVVSIYSTETTTGKTLALIAANSLVGSPRDLLLNRKDTANAMYKIRGVLNHLPACMDEVTTADDRDVADMLYDFSQGREKIRMHKDGQLRDPATWEGPTLMTTNISLHQKVEGAQAGNEPLKARCLELGQHDRTFVTARDGQTRSDSYEFFEILAKNNGWAFPELVAGVIAMGGPEAVWSQAESRFEDKFGFRFLPQERFYRTGIISAWAMGMIGRRLGLFPFDLEDTIRHLLAAVERTRRIEVEHKVDVFDTIGQFLAEHNDQIIEARCQYGSTTEQVIMPVPEKAFVRVKVVYDATSPIMPGSMIAINAEKLRTWLRLKRDGMDRLERELEAEGALLKSRERVTMFKGCPKHPPGQSQCIVLNLNHPRFVDS